MLFQGSWYSSVALTMYGAASGSAVCCSSGTRKEGPADCFAVSWDLSYATLAISERPVRRGWRNPKFLRPSNSKPVSHARLPFAQESSGSDPATDTTVGAMGVLRNLWKKLKETSSSGEKNHSQRRS